MDFAGKLLYRPTLCVLLFVTFARSQTYLGCFKDEGNRMFGHMLEVPNTLTTQFCVTYCQQLGYAYAGLQYSVQCFCGETVNMYSKTAESDCNLSCSGNKSQRCGGDWRNSVYKIDNLRRGYEYMGCYTDEDYPRALSGYYTKSVKLTPFLCIDICIGKGFLYAGLQYGIQCYCGNTLGFNRVRDNECWLKCTGDDTKVCGGYYRNSIFYIGNPEKYLGCYKNTNNKADGHLYTFPNSLTRRKCLDYCKDLGYKYFGLYNRYECVCTDNKPNTATKANEGECSYKCSGDKSQTCGGNQRHSFYQIVNPKAGFTYIGCYLDKSNNRVLQGYYRSFETLTPFPCIELCKEKGFKYAGLQNGSGCYCGTPTVLPNGNKVSDVDCNSKCAGDVNKICGGNRRLSIYATGVYS